MPTTLFRIRSLLMLPIAAAMLLVSSFAVAQPAAAGGGGGCHPGAPLTSARATTVTMEKNCFSPTVSYVDPGNDVTFVNRDPGIHTVTSAAASWGDEQSNYEGLLGGASFTQTFREPGVYPFSCILHPGMVGAIVVGDPQPGTVAAAPLTGGRGTSAGADAYNQDPAIAGEAGNSNTAATAASSAAVAIGAIGITAAALYLRIARARRPSASVAAN